MSRGFFPDDYISSIYRVDFEKLYSEGYRAILFDVDNTLVPHGAPADDAAKDFFDYLRGCGFKTFMISNNKEPRVQSFCKDVQGEGYIYLAKKPRVEGYLKAMEILGTDTSNTLFAGDQVFTDIWGANKAGLRSIMVLPIKKWHEEPQIVLKRFLEAVVMLFYKFRGPVNKVPLITKEKGGES